MKNKNSKPIFVGPSIGMSILCSIPLVAMKLLDVIDISWLWALCPLWLGWVLCFALWLWFSSLNLVCKRIKPIYVPVFVDNSRNTEDKEGKEEDGM